MDNLELEKLKTQTLIKRYNHKHDSKGRFASGGGSSSSGSGGGIKANDFVKMSVDEQKQYLSDMPEGAEIKGVYYKKSTFSDESPVPVTIQKDETTSPKSYLPILVGSSHKGIPEVARLIRDAADGKSEYYFVK